MVVKSKKTSSGKVPLLLVNPKLLWDPSNYQNSLRFILTVSEIRQRLRRKEKKFIEDQLFDTISSSTQYQSRTEKDAEQKKSKKKKKKTKKKK